MKKVAVTGGAGFIGSNLSRALISEGFDVVVIDDLSTGLESNLSDLQVDFRKISITDLDQLKKALSASDVVVHLAARGSVPRSVKDPMATHQVNTLGTLNVLEICRTTGAHFIFSSSSSVYGSNMALPKQEEMWLQPMSPYAASKLGAEGFVSAYASTYDLKTTLLRFFNVFGPYQRPDHEYAAVLPKWIWTALKGVSIELFGDGEQTRDFTYVQTVCDVILSAIRDKIYGPEVINLAYGNKISLNQVIARLKLDFPKLDVIKSPNRLGDVRDSQNNPQRIKSKFPQVAPVPFEVAFDDTLNWLTSQFER
jgi:UDP-glucose 4-epimerase